MAHRYGYLPAVVHTIGFDGKTVPVDGTNPLPTSGGGTGHVIVDSGNIDVTGTVTIPNPVDVTNPMGVLPVAQLTTLHDGKILNRIYPEINEIQGTATGTFDNNKYNMAVTSGQWMVHQTRRFLPYFSGKPQKVELTFDKFAPQANVIKRVGYFSSNTVSPFDSTYDGFYLESGNGTIKFVIKRDGVTVIDADITTWSNYSLLSNYQTLAEWDNFTVIEFNFLWLGGAYIELRVVTDTGFTTVHQLIYAGTSQDVFIKSPNQPVRYEIRSTTGTGAFRYICNQVATGGAIEQAGISHGVSTGTTAVNMSTIGTTYPVLGITKQAVYRNNAIRFSHVDILVASSDTILWSLQVNPTLSAGLTYNNTPNSSTAFAIANGTTTVTSPGNIIATGYLVQNARIDPSTFERNYMSWLSGALDGTQDKFVVCITPISTNVTVYSSIETIEV